MPQKIVRPSREQIQIPAGHSFRVLRWSRSLAEVESVLGAEKPQRIAGEGTHWHYHLEMELTLFKTGEGTRFVGDHIAPFAAGDLVLLGERLPHYWHTRGPSSGLSVQWHFPHGHPFWGFPEMLALAALFKKSGRGLRFTGPTAQALTAGLHDVTHAQGADRLGILLRLLARMAAAPRADQEALSARSFLLSAKSLHQQTMSEAVRHLLAHFREPIRLEDLLRLTRMSKPTFCRQFKTHSGKTFSDFISQLRLQNACRELVESDRSVLEIALSTGFSQISFFNRIFRRTLRCTPLEYRERTRKRSRKRCDG